MNLNDPKEKKVEEEVEPTPAEVEETDIPESDDVPELEEEPDPEAE